MAIRSFAAIGLRAVGVGPVVLAILGGGARPGGGVHLQARVRLGQRQRAGPVLNAWLWTRAVQADGRLVIAIDGKTIHAKRQRVRDPQRTVKLLQTA